MPRDQSGLYGAYLRACLQDDVESRASRADMAALVLVAEQLMADEREFMLAMAYVAALLHRTLGQVASQLAIAFAQEWSLEGTDNTLPSMGLVRVLALVGARRRRFSAFREDVWALGR